MKNEINDGPTQIFGAKQVKLGNGSMKIHGSFSDKQPGQKM